MSFKFEKLEVWHESMDLADDINRMTASLPKTEIFNLSSQIRRAADSVSLNIAEGSTATSNAEQARFINIAIRSCNEVVCCLYKCARRKYVDDNCFQLFYNKYDRLGARLQAFRNALVNK